MKLTRILAAALLASAFAASAAAESQADYAGKISSLLAGMGSGDLKVRKQSQAAFEDICHTAAAPGREADRLALCKAVVARLGPDSPTEARVWMLRHLQQIGRAEVVDAVGALLADKDERIRRCALRAMKNNPTDEAVARLRAELARAGKAEWRIACINALAFRGDAGSVGSIAGYLGGTDKLVVEAAAAALGKIGGVEAARALTAARAGRSGWLKAAVTDAALVCAEGLLDAGRRAAALEVYDKLFAPGEDKRTRIAALQGLAAAGSAKAPACAIGLLQANDVVLQQGAIVALRRVPADRAAVALSAAMGALPVPAKVMALTLIADRPSPEAFDAAASATKDADGGVRAAAVVALGRLGDRRGVGVLGALAAAGGAERNAAREALAGMNGQGVDEAILAGARSGDGAVRVALIGVLQARRTPGAVDVLLAAAEDRDEPVRSAALKALGTLAGEADLPGVVKLLVKAQAPGVRAAAAKAVAGICGRAGDKGKCAAVLTGAMPGAGEAATASILGALGKLGGAGALAAVRKASGDAREKVRDAAIRSLSAWPDEAAAPDLLAVARSKAGRTHRVLALRGYVSMIAKSARPAAAKLAALSDAMAAADRDAEKKQVLAAVANVTHADALKFVERYLADKQLAAEARAAVKRIKADLAGPMRVWASHGKKSARNAVDGKKDTRWTTGAHMAGGEWFAIDIRAEKAVRLITLDAGKSQNDYPRGWEVYVSNSEKDWGKPVATGKGKKALVTIRLRKPVPGRYIKIVQTGKAKGLFWSIHALKVETD